jgi:crotonobetainyl-CoA:carnitine CoA-transferase CaiB-like acyl-CoA transferase
MFELESGAGDREARLMAGVFDGIRVLDLSWGIAGPMTTMLLADNGADVIRIERPGGDPFIESSGYHVWNRGKRSATIDLCSEEGCAAFRALVAGADVVIDSFSPGVTTQLGIDHESLAAINPRLITCSITAYGDHPAHRDRPGYDALVAARTGIFYDQKGRLGTAMEYIAGRSGPEPEFGKPENMVRGADREGPIFPRSTWPSIGATYYGMLGIAAALRARVVTGEGQWVTTSLLQGALAAVSLNWQRVENPDAPLYWMWPVDSRSIEGLFECSDGRWVHHWTVRPRWVLTSAEGETLESTELDTAYRDDPDRISMESDGLLSGYFLYPMLVEAFKKFPAAEWERAAEKAGVGCSVVRSPSEALAMQPFLDDGCVVEVQDPELGRVRYAGNLLEFSHTPSHVRGPSPRFGEHTDDVLAEAATARSTAPFPLSPTPLNYPLDGIRVLDLGLGVAGPYTGRALSDLGADVIKVNALYDSFWNGTHMGLGTNRGKRSIAINIKSEGGRSALEKLIESADVLTLNWRPGAAARLNLDYETLHAKYPRLIYCNTRGYEKGPRSDLPGTDQTIAALTGGEWEDGGCDSGNPPMWSRSNMGDTGNAMLAAIAITSALYHREVTGQGQAVATSIVNAGLLHNSYSWIHADGTPGDMRHIDAGQYGLSPLYRMYKGSDEDWFFLAAVTEEERRHLAKTIDASGGPDLEANDLVERLEALFATQPAAEWFEILDGAGVPVEVIDEDFCRTIFDDPVARDEELIVETPSKSVGRFEDPGLLVKVGPNGGIIRRGPCQCGEHTVEILNEHGYTEAEIAGLVALSAVGVAPGVGE